MPLDTEALRRRILQARSEAGLTQAELAAGGGLDRSAIAKIETGTRGVSALELARLSQALGQRVEWLLEDGPPAVVSHRVRRGIDASVAQIDRELERLARDVDFVAAHSASLKLLSREPWPVPESASDAEDLAQRIRAEVGLQKNAPAENLVELFATVGLLIFVSNLGAEGADGGTVLLREGGVSLVNSSSQLGRRRLTATHELAHYLVADEYAVDWRISETANSARSEALFDRFARAFLLPESGLTQYWEAVVDEGIRAASVRTASRFRVDMATLARRLSELDLVARGDAERVRAVRTGQADILDFNLVVPFELEGAVLPPIYERAILSLYRGERISAERALSLLRGKYQVSDLPELPLPREDELWSILS